MSEVAVADAGALGDEDLWRAALYALIGRLFFDGPDDALLAQLSTGIVDGGADDDGPLPKAWQQLAQASSAADVVALRHEHAMLFIGVGKTPVTPYTSAYVAGVSPERHLLLLRQQLEQWGLGRDATTSTPEDHLSGVCDTMRHLILRSEQIEVQKEFFNNFICLQCISLCRKLLDAAPSGFYLNVARFTQAFIEVEREGFDLIVSRV